MAKYRIETDNGNYEIETEEQPQSLTDQVKSAIPGAMNIAKQAVSNTPMGLVASGQDIAQKGADVIGERGAEELAKGGMEPHIAAGLGTVAQMAPSIIGSTMPTESAALNSTETTSPMASRLSQIATDARMRGFKVPGTAVDQTGELGSMRESINTLKGQGVEPKIFESAEALGNRVKSNISEYGQAVREIPNTLDTHGIKPRLNENTLPTYLENELKPAYEGGSYDAEAQIAKEIADTAKGHSDSFNALLDLKQKLGEQGKFYRVNTGEPNAPLRARMYQEAYGKVNDILKNEINAVSPELAPAWEQANKIYSAGKDVIPHLTKSAGKEAASDISQFDLHKPLSMVQGGTNRAIALGADTLSQMVQSGSNAMGKFTSVLKNAAAQGPKAFAVTHYTLSQKSPEYRDLISKGQENE